MRPRLILIGLLLSAFAGGLAAAQPAGALKLRGRFTTPAQTQTPSPDAAMTASADLRGPLSAVPVDPAAAIAAPVVTDDDGTPLAPPPAASPSPGQSFAGGLPSGSASGFAASTLPALPTLPTLPVLPGGDDSAPICRAQCSKARAFCPANEDPSCTSRWAQCIAACSDAVAR